MKQEETTTRSAPLALRPGEVLLWQGFPNAPPRIPARPAHAVVTLSSAFGVFAFWVMVPELPSLRAALLLPLGLLLVMAALPPLTARRRAKAFFHSARYSLTTQRAVSSHKEKTIEVPLTPQTKAHIKEAPAPALVLWTQANGPQREAVYFHQLENPEEPYRIARTITDAAP